MVNIFICPLNGRSRVGKDTFVKQFGELIEDGKYTVDTCMGVHLSAVRYLKKAMPIMVNEEYFGSAEQRTFLFELLKLVNSYKPISQILLEKIHDICNMKMLNVRETSTKIFFIDMRDPNDIIDLKNRINGCISTEFVKDHYVNFIFKSIIIENKDDNIDPENLDDWDKHIFDIDYDYRIDNSGTIEDLKSEAQLLFKDFMEMRPLISFGNEDNLNGT